MSAIKYIWKAGKIVATIIGTMVVKEKGGLGKDGYIGQIKKK